MTILLRIDPLVTLQELEICVLLQVLLQEMNESKSFLSLDTLFNIPSLLYDNFSLFNIKLSI